MKALADYVHSNKEVIAVNQDPLGKQGRRLKLEASQEIWVRPLADGSVAAGLFNRGNEPAQMALQWSELNFEGKLKGRDLWAHTDLDCAGESFAARVPADGVVLIRVGKTP